MRNLGDDGNALFLHCITANILILILSNSFFQDVSLKGNWVSGIWNFSISFLATAHESTITGNF